MSEENQPLSTNQDTNLDQDQPQSQLTQPTQTTQLSQENQQQVEENSIQTQIDQKKCAVCEKTGELLRCSKCKSTYYCSGECQKNDWPTHKKVCQPPIPPKGRSLDDFSNLDFVGQGNFSTIHSGIDRKDGKKYAIKKYIKRKLTQVNKEKDVYMEKHCLSKLLENEYVIRLYETFQDDDSLYMKMELVDGGELWNEIHVFGAIAKSLIRYYFGHILKAIESIHKVGLVHRDIKSENILLTKEKKIKFIDFGTARDLMNPEIKGSGNGLKGKRVYEHFVGTPQFMAPECIRNKNSDYKSDIYSLGCLFYQLISGQPPYNGKSDYLIFTAALETEAQFPEKWIFDEDEIDLIKKMIERDPEKRIDLKGVMEHTYWNWNEWDDNYDSCRKNVTEMEEFLLETRNKLYKMEQVEKKNEKEDILDDVLEEQRKKVKDDEWSTKLKYLEVLAKEHLLVEEEQHMQG